MEQKNAIHKIFENRKLNNPNPKTALVLSIIFPGAGQIYAGDVKDGINSLLLTSFIAVVAVYVAFEYQPLDAISIVPWFMRFYQGGIFNAKKIAETNRQFNRNQIFNNILLEINKCDC